MPSPPRGCGLRSIRRWAKPPLRQAALFQKAKLTASGGTSDNEFGLSVAISGSTAVVGAPGANSSTGAAYVFTHSGGAWSQQAELTAANGVSGDLFGWSVAISGATAVVGADGKNQFTGAAYVFVRSGSTWSQQAKLAEANPSPGDEFGFSVTVSKLATTGKPEVVVGAPDANSATGAAYVFTPSGSTWSRRAKLTASDGAANDEFGYSVALAASTAVVGAPGANSATGAAYVFTHSGSRWSQRTGLTASDGAANDEFGWSVAVAGTTAVVGAPGRKSGTGAAYVFLRSGGTWSPQAEPTASDGAANDEFGYSVALAGSTAVVGAPGQNSATGAMYVFVHSGSGWSQMAEPTASDGAANDGFGRSVGISGSTAVAGAYGASSLTGAAYVFLLPSQQAKLADPGGVSGDNFGWSVSISGTTAVVGAYGVNSSTGAAYVFVRSGSTWSQQATLTASDAAENDEFGYSVTLAGSTAVIGAPGSNSGTGAAYVFARSGSTWSQQAKLTASDGAAGDNFGWSVARSGTTLVVGAYGQNQFTGAVYVFTGPGSTWSQQAKLTNPGNFVQEWFGYSVTISGSTLVVGTPFANPFDDAGGAYVYVRSGSTWSEQTELTAHSPVSDGFGWSVALAGSKVLVGSPHTGVDTGAVYVFTVSDGTWSRRATLTGTDTGQGDAFGSSVAISGSTAVVGAPTKGTFTGAVYVFTGSGGTWSQQAELTASDTAQGNDFGVSVAVSGATAVVGAFLHANSAGAAYVFGNV